MDAGRAVFVKHGCYSCHRFPGMEGLGKIGPSLAGVGDRAVDENAGAGHLAPPTLPNWIFLKLQTPEALAERSRMPTYNLSETEAAAVTVALLSLRAEDLPASRVTSEPLATPYQPQGEFGSLVGRYRCLSCHRIRGWGGDLSTVPLDRIGSQLQGGYLQSYLANPGAVRVATKAPIPMTPAEARSMADYFSTVFIDDVSTHGHERRTGAPGSAALRAARLPRRHICGGDMWDRT